MNFAIVGRVDCSVCEGERTGAMCSCSVEVTWDGRTVWVCDQEGATIGRYSAIAGVDVHGTFEEQHAGDLCRDCRLGVTGDEGWDAFIAGMLQHHQVAVPEEARPCQN